MPVDTTNQPNDSWQEFTLVKKVANSGKLSLEFSTVSGDPWLDSVGDITITPASRPDQ